MWINSSRWLILLLLVWPQISAAETPLSAINWLSDSVATPVALTPLAPETETARSALPEEVTVTPLGRVSPDAVGLLPVSSTGLPADLWGSSASVDLARRFKAERVDLLPAMQDLLYMLLLAELDPPGDSGASPVLFLARIDTLLALGALDPAMALLERAGFDHPEIFRRYFDVALLIGAEDRACATLRSTPGLSPTFLARIFCLARGGDWDAAALTLDSARALGIISDQDDALLARFLDPALVEGEAALPTPSRPSPLVFRMMEAIGEAMPTSKLPRAFGNADLNANSGWKAQLEAAERLSRTGAIDANKLLGLYTERRPAASGGVWDRVRALQDFDAAMIRGDVDAVADTLPDAWAALAGIELENTFARLYALPLSALPLSGDAGALAFHIQLLAADYETAAKEYAPSSKRDQLLKDIARGEVPAAPGSDPLAGAIVDGFAAKGIPVRLQSLTSEGRLGEAILRAIEMFTDGSRGDLDEVSDALAFFRAVGLEDTARRAALELLLLERRG